MQEIENKIELIYQVERYDAYAKGKGRKHGQLMK